MKKSLLSSTAIIAIALAMSTQAPIAQAPRSAVVAIRGGTVLTVTRGTIQNGTVVLRDGKIAAVGGSNVEVPSGAEVIDAKGRFVTPGIIDAHSHIAADSINEGGTTVSSMTGIEDVLDPTDVNIYRDLAGGLTVANVLHGSANPIGGKNQVIKLRWGKDAKGLVFEGAPPGIKFALGENPKDMRQFGQTGPRRYPITRPGVEFVIRDAFSRAKAYQREWQEYERRRKAAEDVAPPRRDLQLEPLVEILEGKRLVHAHTYRADETLMLIRVAEEMGFKIATFQHILEGYKVADEMARHGAGGSTFSDWWAYKVEAEDAIPYNATLMHKRGVLVSVNSDSAEHARRLNTEAAKSMHWGGVTEDEALSFVTINPARQLRIDSRVGSLEVGKDADVVIWNKHPLSTYAIVDKVFIDGQQYYDRLAEERRMTDARQEKSTLAAAEGRSATAPQTPQTPQPRTSQSLEETFGSVAPEGRAMQATQATGAAIAITNARIHPISSAPIERGTIVIRGNRIEAIGADVAAPAGAQVIDAKGGEVYPGFIDARTTMGLNEPGPRGFEDVNEMLEINAAVKAQVAYQADSDAIPVARANGITTVAVIPAGGLIGGQIAVMNLDGWTWEEATLKPVAGVSFQFPLLVRGGGGGGGGGGANADINRKYEDLKKERDARVQRVEDLIARARAYGKIPAAERATDWNLAALAPVAEGRQPLFVTASNEREIRDAVAFADRAGVKIVIVGGLEAPVVAPLLKEKNIPVILGSVLGLPTREDFHHAATYRAAGELAQAGLTFAFGTGGAANNRLLPYEAAISVAWGLDRNRALRALTLDAANILGVADRVGSLRARQGGQPVRRHRRSDGDEDAVHAHLHQRQERRAQDQAHRSLRTVLFATSSWSTAMIRRRNATTKITNVTKRTKAFCQHAFAKTCFVVFVSFVPFVVAFNAAAQQEATYTYAITGARIVPVTGSIIDSGTIVMSDGVIAAVGTNVTVPPGAITIAGKGLTVYPGLIDMGSTAGLDTPSIPRAENPQTTEDVERVKRESLLRAHLKAADHMNPKAAALEKAAQAGITAQLATPGSDGIRGQSALVLTAQGGDVPQIGALADDRRGTLVIKTPVALHVGTADNPAGGVAYPNSLMGLIAFNRQAFLDAQWYQARKTDVVYSAALEAMQPALAGRMPVAFRASTTREVLRSLDMARAFKLDPIVTAAREIEDVTADLKAANARVIYSLNYPTRRPSLAPDSDEPLQVLRERANAPKAPAILDKAGILFAFESNGLSEPKDFLKNAQKAVAAGLSKEAALKALTINAAQIAGSGDRLGSLDRGKIANVVVSEGDLFDEKSTIKHVFVSGRPVKLN